MVNIVDPVSTGLVASLARPGGNVTGLAVDAGGEILGKRFELLKEMLPKLSRLGIMWNPDVEASRSRQAAMTETATVPQGAVDATIEAAEECPGECIFLEIIGE